MSTKCMLCFLFIAILSLSLAGQAIIHHCGISGRVLDPSGAAVVGARVEVRNTVTGETKVANSDGNGHYTFDGLLPEGQYQLGVGATGFQRLVRDGIVTKAGQDMIANLDFRIVNRQEIVTVVETSEYAVPDTATVSKTDTPITQIPFAVQVVSSGVIQDQQALRLPDVTR